MDTLLHLPAAIGVPAVALGGITLFFVKEYSKKQNNGMPEVPGYPLVGNLLQLTEKKPYKTFANWAETYGPVFSVKTGASKMVVLNTADVAKEAMVTKYSSISSRKLSNALKILTGDKSIVAMSDYNDFYKTAKRHLLNSTLGTNAQKRHRGHRDDLVNACIEKFDQHFKVHNSKAVNFREIFQSELFGLSMKEAIGEDVQSIYVEELGATLSRDEIFQILVVDPMIGAIEVDWRDFFPYLKWVPNKSFENKVEQMDFNRRAVMRSLIEQQKKRIDSGVEINCYLDHLLSEATGLSEQQKLTLIWEVIIESSDTTLVTAEWAMYELAKNPEKQNKLLEDITRVCGSEKLTEDKLSQIPYLSAVFHETLRAHSPVSLLPLRHVHEKAEIGGYPIDEGTEIAINIYACNMDKNVWDNPEEWKPERFLTGNNDTLDLHKTMAFGGGKRICAGALQAMLISTVAIGRFVQEFEWKLKDGEEGNVDTVGLTTHKLHPLLAIIKPRN